VFVTNAWKAMIATVYLLANYFTAEQWNRWMPDEEKFADHPGGNCAGRLEQNTRGKYGSADVKNSASTHALHLCVPCNKKKKTAFSFQHNIPDIH
jgi:hypothetical protein